MTRAPGGIKRGKPTAGERAEIESIAAAMTHPTPSKIARRLNRHTATVTWYCITHGLVERRRPSAPLSASYVRNGRRIHRYDAEEDALILAMRVQDFSFVEIARHSNARFNRDRNEHGIRVRCVVLASYDDEGTAAS
jgi:IS30 family transposase